jgi:hypothetical protein
MLGNDGASYASKADKRGIYRWVKSGSAGSMRSTKNKTIKKTSGMGTGCFKDLKRTSSPFYKYAYKKSVFAPVNVSNFLIVCF